MNYYTILEIDHRSTQEEIKKAYRKLSLKHHPDRNHGTAEATQHFQKLNQAYEVLSDVESRKAYDLQCRFSNSSSSSSSATNAAPCNDLNFDTSDLLGFFSKQFFGGEGSAFDKIKASMGKPTPIILHETITLSKAYMGGTIPVFIHRWIVTPDNMKIEESETVYVTIPRGIDNNELVILREKGNVLKENNKGDVKVFIKIVADVVGGQADNKTIEPFTRKGLDLHLTKTITLKESLAGFTFDLHYLDGRVFKIANASTHTLLPHYTKCINGMGMKRDEHVGNLVIIFNVEFPKLLTEIQRETLLNLL